MTDAVARYEAFEALHRRGHIFVMPNPWDVGSARLMAGMGFEALATTSWGAAMAAGRMDGGGKITRDVALAHAAALVGATDLPVSADLEDGFGRDPEAVAATVRAATEVGLAGCSIEDTTGDDDRPIHEQGLAVERVAAAAEAARECGRPFMLTARAEGFSYGQPDLDAVLDRLLAFEAVGADVLYAPELPDLDAVRTICAAVTSPVNVVAGLGLSPEVSLAELNEAGARRLSLGSSPFRAAAGGLIDALDALQRGGDLRPLSSGASFSTVEGLIQRGTPE